MVFHGEGWTREVWYDWLTTLLGVGWERPERPGDAEFEEWYAFAADWARELFQAK